MDIGYIDHVGIRVHDERQSLCFYEKLGFFEHERAHNDPVIIIKNKQHNFCTTLTLRVCFQFLGGSMALMTLKTLLSVACRLFPETIGPPYFLLLTDGPSQHWISGLPMHSSSMTSLGCPGSSASSGALGKHTIVFLR